MNPDLEVSRDIAASPQAVFDVLTDITRMGEFSPENYACEWNEGFSKAEVGAMYTGHNRNGEKEWTTESKIIELVPNERFAFDCIARGTFTFATWAYSIEATENGCRVTEYWEDKRPQEMRGQPSEVSGVTDRVGHNRTGMEVTLEKLAAAVE